MLKFETPTRKLINWDWYIGKRKSRCYSDAQADKLLDTTYAQWKDGFVVEYKKISAGKLTVCIPAEKPAPQKALEAANPEKIKEACNAVNESMLAQAVQRDAIDMDREKEAFLGSCDSDNTKKTYRCRIDMFLKYCKEQGIDPRMITSLQATEFLNWLRRIGKSNSVIRITIAANRSFYEMIWEHHNLTFPLPFKSKGLMPRKAKVKMTYVPDETEIAKLLDFFKEKNPIVYTAIYFMQKFGMRIGAFEKMDLEGNQAVTISKMKHHKFIFDEEDIELWKTNPLNSFTAENLGYNVNYHLKQVFQGKVTKHGYTCHDFRRFFAIKLFNKTKNVFEVSETLGHANIAATDTYLKGLRRNAVGYTLVK